MGFCIIIRMVTSFRSFLTWLQLQQSQPVTDTFFFSDHHFGLKYSNNYWMNYLDVLLRYLESHQDEAYTLK